MKKIIALALVTLFTTTAMADQYVRGYTRSDGTYVQPYHRSNPDGNPYNNYSTQGNSNPYTMEPGHEQPKYNSGSIAPSIIPEKSPRGF